MDGVKAKEILDTRAGISIAAMEILDTRGGINIIAKAIWEQWGIQALRNTQMALKLAYGNIEHPLGFLEHVIVIACVIEYEHTFVIVDFDQDPSYEVIIGRPFMHQLMVMQDKVFNYLYLRHIEVITKVNLKDHSYQDVTKTPRET